MADPKILLFYVFTPLADPEAVRLWQRDLCESLGLRGRILLSAHGINATVGGEQRAVKRYARKLREYAPFASADLKWSQGSGLTAEPGPSGWLEIVDFPKLSVKVRRELVSFGVPDEVVVDEHGVVGGGPRLSPQALHGLIDERGDEVVLFDGRNAREAMIGRFDDAVVPDVTTTHDFIDQLDSGAFDHLKDRPVVTYCTGGVRCEILTSLMKTRGFGEVYQLDGGIVRYGEVYGDAGLWSGSLYVFDGRQHTEFTKDAEVLGRCNRCGAPTHTMETIDAPQGRIQLVTCDACLADGPSPAPPA
ncbi:MAG: rhodanese-related sulfurtransferase [Solirubrobacteraceae bacterium]|nr:rhodanese-related sulfurtransferase [Solirubrobacteraceae bacterium]